MPPPGEGHGIAIVIGAHPASGKMPPPGADDKPMSDSDGKVSPEEATIIRSDEHCIDCKNYDPTSGECAKISGSFDPQDACVKFFEAIGNDEPDADDTGGTPDNDSDDSAGMTQ